MPAHARCLGLPALSADIQFGFNILADVVVRKMSLIESAEHAVRPGTLNPQHETLFERRRDEVTERHSLNQEQETRNKKPAFGVLCCVFPVTCFLLLVTGWDGFRFSLAIQADVVVRKVSCDESDTSSIKKIFNQKLMLLMC